MSSSQASVPFSMETTVADNLTPQQKEDIEAAFKQFDKNDDGEIPIEDLGEAMKVAGYLLDEEALAHMKKVINFNDDDKVQYKEYEAMMATQMHGYTTSDEDLKMYLRRFNKNRDGFITLRDLKHVLTLKPFGERELTKEEVKSIINSADTDKEDKEISIEDFVASLKL